MPRTKITINQESLLDLGPERLADLLIEHSFTDKSLEKKLRLALAANQGADSLIQALSLRIQGLRRGSRFVEWHEASKFARDIDEIRSAIVDDLALKAPRSAADLLADLVHTSNSVYGRADDSSGSIADVYRLAIADWGRVWSRIPDRRPEVLAGTVLHEFQHDDYGLKSGMIKAFADALGENGLGELRRLLNAELDRLAVPEGGKWDSKRSAVIRGLEEVADALHDVDAYVDAVDLSGHPERYALEIAGRLLSAGRPQEALEWLDRASPQPTWAGSRQVDLRIAALDALDRVQEAQDVRWAWFTDTLSLEHFRAFLDRVPQDERDAAEDRAVEVAEGHASPEPALWFLTEIGRLDTAERLILDRIGEISGRDYRLLRPVAERLTPTHPLGAVLLYRAMCTAVLNEARSKSYPYAARDLIQAGEAAEQVKDWNGVEPHADFIRRLRAGHGRKSAFWPLVEGR